MKRRTNLAALILIALVAFLAGLYGLGRFGLVPFPREFDPLALPDLAAKPGWITPFQLKTVDASGLNCQLALARVGIDVALQPTRFERPGCSREDTVVMSRLSAVKLRPEETRCAIMARLYMWERHELQPAARLILGEPVTEILHFGSYSCRTMRGKSAMSEHATANAFDISGFRLASGKQISVLKDWRGNDKEARFLHRVRDGLCSYFNLTLSPDYNADHANHFHVDMGWYRRCR